MTVANITAKRVSDNVIFQATGDTPFNFTGLGSGVDYDVTMPDGTVLRRTTLAGANLARLSSTQVINNGANQTSYISPQTFTADAGADLIVAVVTIYSAADGPTDLTVEIGGSTFTQSFLSITRGNGNRSIGVFYLDASDIPSGANNIEVTGLIGSTPAETRACQVELIQYSGANQSNPLYFNSIEVFSRDDVGSMASTLTMQSDADQHIAVFSQVPGGVTALPATTDRTLLRAAETGISVSNNVAVLISASSPAVAGASTHTGSMSSNVTASAVSFGVRAA